MATREHIQHTSRFLLLSRNEKLIFSALINHGNMNVTDISRITTIKRTTIYTALRQLHARGLIRKVPLGKRIYWKAVPFSKIDQLLSDHAYELGEMYKLDATDIRHFIEARSYNKHLQTVYGAKGMRKTYELLLAQSKATRIYAIQGNISAEYVLKSSQQYFIEYHKKLKQAKIIIEAINGKRVLQLINKLSLDALYSHDGRMIISTIIPDDYMEFDGEIIFFADTMLIVHAATESATIIRNPVMSHALLALFQLLQSTGKKVDLNAYIKNCIKERESRH